MAALTVDASVTRFLETPDIPLLGAKKLSPRQRWGLAVTEPLLASCKCYVFKLNLPQWSKFYVFGRHICFRTLLSVGPLKAAACIPFAEIAAIAAGDGVLLNSLRIDRTDGSNVFVAFELPEDRARILAICDKVLRRSRSESSISFDVSSTDSVADDEEEEDPGIVADTASVAASLGLPAVPASDPRPLRILKGGKPKHITVFTIGSRGDVQPFISLCKSLMKRGYTTRIASFAEYGPWVQSHNIEFRPVAGDPTTIMSLCVENGMFTFNFLKEGVQQLEWIKNLFSSAYEATEGTDLILLTQSAMIGANLAAARCIPTMHVFTMPWSATKEFPHPFLVPDRDKGPAYNLSSWKLILNGMGAGVLPKVNEFRKAHKLPATWPQGPIDYSLIPTIYCFSETLVPKPSDWSPHTHNAGFFFLDNPDLAWQPPSDLLEFLERKDAKKIVYIGFGSIVVQDPEGMSRAIIEAVERAGVRAIVSEGWSARGKKKGGEQAVNGSSGSNGAGAGAGSSVPNGEQAVFPTELSLPERATEFLLGQGPMTNSQAYAGLYQLLSDYSRLSGVDSKNGLPSPLELTTQQIAALDGNSVMGQPIPIRGVAPPLPARSKSKHPVATQNEPIVWPSSIYKVSSIPHDWLFPQLDGVVHHGGAGSTAAGLRAGCPTIIKPFFGDQEFWGLAIEREGLGVVVKDLDAGRLAEALAKITTDESMRERARRVGERLRAEDGPEKACDLIEAEMEYAQNLMEDVLISDHEKMRLNEQRRAHLNELKGKKKALVEQRTQMEAKLKAQGMSKSEIEVAVKETLLRSVSVDDEGDESEDELLQTMTEISIGDGSATSGAVKELAIKAGRGLLKATVLGAGLVTTGQVFGLQVVRNTWGLVVGGGRRANNKEQNKEASK